MTDGTRLVAATPEANSGAAGGAIEASGLGGLRQARSKDADAKRALPRSAEVDAGGAILALDPGTTETGFVYYFAGNVVASGVKPNDMILQTLRDGWDMQAHVLAIEMIASYGMPVGREVFETCVWIGRFMQAWQDPASVRLVYRRDVKLHLCGSPRAKDPNVRQALIDLFPATGGGKTPQIGTKKQPGPLFGVSSHAWPALGVAVTAKAQMEAA